MAKIVKSFNYLAIAILLIALVGFVTNAGAVDENLTFAWTQEGEVEGWYLYIADEEAGTYNKVIDPDGNEFYIDKNSVSTVEGEYQSDQTFTVTGTPGTKVTKYFKMSAYNSTFKTAESELSNSTSYEFEIPMVAPYLIDVSVKVQAK